MSKRKFVQGQKVVVSSHCPVQARVSGVGVIDQAVTSGRSYYVKWPDGRLMAYTGIELDAAPQDGAKVRDDDLQDLLLDIGDLDNEIRDVREEMHKLEARRYQKREEYRKLLAEQDKTK